MFHPSSGDHLEKHMTRKDIQELILEIIADIDEDADFEGLQADQPLRDQLDLDSMDFLDIVMELRKRYKLQIPEEDYPQLASLDSCVNYLEPLLKDA
jgi:acyl carrier protein